MQDFRNLSVWQRAHSLTLEVYRVTRGFPRDELYGLVSQLRRSSVSVPSNIAEGCCRQGDLEFARFLQIAMGSASEVEYQLLLSKELDYLSAPDHERLQQLLEEVKRMLAALLSRLRPQSGQKELRAES